MNRPGFQDGLTGRSHYNWLIHCFNALEDIGIVLECFDERASDDEPRVSARLMPQVLGTDWHMGRWEPQFREALQSLITLHNIGPGLRVPMQMLRSALLLLLIRTISQKLDPRRICSAMVLEALKDTGFTSSLVYYVDTSAMALEQ